jgi:hypothetical protein
VYVLEPKVLGGQGQHDLPHVASPGIVGADYDDVCRPVVAQLLSHPRAKLFEHRSALLRYLVELSFQLLQVTDEICRYEGFGHHLVI